MKTIWQLWFYLGMTHAPAIADAFGRFGKPVQAIDMDGRSAH